MKSVKGITTITELVVFWSLCSVCFPDRALYSQILQQSSRCNHRCWQCGGELYLPLLFFFLSLLNRRWNPHTVHGDQRLEDKMIGFGCAGASANIAKDGLIRFLHKKFHLLVVSSPPWALLKMLCSSHSGSSRMGNWQVWCFLTW